MGYKLKKRRVTLKFEGAYEGAEVVCDLSASTGLVRDVQDAATSDRIDHLYALLRENVILEWNLETDEGEPISLTADGFATVDHALVMNIATHWLAGIGDVDGPLALKSRNGATPEAALAGMGSYTESQ